VGNEAKAYARAFEARKQGRADRPDRNALKEKRAIRLLAAEGATWAGEFRPRNTATATDAEFTRSFGKAPDASTWHSAR